MARRVFILLFAAAATYAQVPSDPGHEAVRAMQKGNFESARQLLASALQGSPRDARLWTLQGLALVQLNAKADALSSFHRALALAPDYFPACEGAAQLELETHNPHAVETLKHLQALRPDDPAILRQLAYLLVQQKKPGEAVPFFERLAAMQPSDEKAFVDLAAAEFLAGNYSGVISTLAPLAAEPNATPELFDLLAQAYGFTSQTEKAIATLQTALAAHPDAPQLYVDYANICLANGCFQPALAAVSSGLTRLPDSARLYVARGVLYSELADYDKGEADFRKAEQLDPDVEGGSFSHGLAELEHNDLARAEAIVRARLQTKPDDPFLNYLLAEVLTRKGAEPGTKEFAEALRAAAKSSEAKPDLAPARDLLGRLYVQEGNLPEGIRQSRLALQLNPKDQKALYHLITALRKANQTSEVPALLHQLVQLREQAGKLAASDHAFTAPGNQ